MAFKNHPARLAAIAAKAATFRTGEPCRRGHEDPPRKTGSGKCYRCAREEAAKITAQFEKTRAFHAREEAAMEAKIKEGWHLYAAKFPLTKIPVKYQ